MTSLTQLKANQRELKKLFASRGWAILSETMHTEILQAALAIANSANMSLDEINFRRGAIWAANQLLNLPDALIQRLEGSIAIEEATLPATAGNKETE
jgi:hypothetical protein